MTNLRNTAAIVALTAGLTALPLLASAQILGGGGQVQGGVTGQVGVGGVQDTLGHTTQPVDDAASRAQSDADAAHQQTQDTTQQLQGAAKVDGTVEAKGDTKGNVTTGGSVTVMGDPAAVTGAAASGANNAKNDANSVAGQASDTVQGASNATSSADLSAEARADAQAKADVEKK